MKLAAARFREAETRVLAGEGVGGLGGDAGDGGGAAGGWWGGEGDGVGEGVGGRGRGRGWGGRGRGEGEGGKSLRGYEGERKEEEEEEEAEGEGRVEGEVWVHWHRGAGERACGWLVKCARACGWESGNRKGFWRGETGETFDGSQVVIQHCSFALLRGRYPRNGEVTFLRAIRSPSTVYPRCYSYWSLQG